MYNEELRPLDLGQILDKSFRLAFATIKKNLLLFLIFGGVFIGATVIFSIAIFVPTLFLEMRGSGIEGNPVLFFLIIFGSVILYCILLGVGFVFYYGLLYDICIKTYLGEEWTFASSLKLVKNKFWTMILAGFLSMLVIFVGYMACLVGAIPAAALIAFVMPAILYENRGATSALSRSFKLTGYSFWPVLGTILLISLIIGGLSSVLSMTMQLPMMFISPMLEGSNSSMELAIGLIIFTGFMLILYMFFTVFSQIIIIASYTIIYFNQRVKFEHFGVEKMATELVDELNTEFRE